MAVSSADAAGVPWAAMTARPNTAAVVANKLPRSNEDLSDIALFLVTLSFAKRGCRAVEAIFLEQSLGWKNRKWPNEITSR
jgi:hypothetical protein